MRYRCCCFTYLLTQIHSIYFMLFLYWKHTKHTLWGEQNEKYLYLYKRKQNKVVKICLARLHLVVSINISLKNAQNAFNFFHFLFRHVFFFFNFSLALIPSLIWWYYGFTVVLLWPMRWFSPHQTYSFFSLNTKSSIFRCNFFFWNLLFVYLYKFSTSSYFCFSSGSFKFWLIKYLFSIARVSLSHQ